MTVPTKATAHMMPCCTRIPGHYILHIALAINIRYLQSYILHKTSTYLDRTSQQMAVMWHSSGKWRPIKEHILWLPFCPPQLLLKRINRFPIFQYTIFLFRKVEESALFYVFHGTSSMQKTTLSVDTQDCESLSIYISFLSFTTALIIQCYRVKMYWIHLSSGSASLMKDGSDLYQIHYPNGQNSIFLYEIMNLLNE